VGTFGTNYRGPHLAHKAIIVCKGGAGADERPIAKPQEKKKKKKKKTHKKNTEVFLRSYSSAWLIDVFSTAQCVFSTTDSINRMYIQRRKCQECCLSRGSVDRGLAFPGGREKRCALLHAEIPLLGRGTELLISREKSRD